MCGHGPPVEKPNFNVVCVGLSKSGKSTLLSVLSGESTDNIEPTIGMYTFHKYVKFFSFVYITGYTRPLPMASEAAGKSSTWLETRYRSHCIKLPLHNYDGIYTRQKCRSLKRSLKQSS